MINKNATIAPGQSALDNAPINLRAFFIKYLRYWPFFLASIVIAMAIAVVYTKYATPAYDVSATLMIKDNTDQAPEQKTSLVEFQALEQVNAPKVVENEIEILRSNQLVSDVVNYFQLWADYKLKGGIIKDQDLYGINPVKINLINPIGPVPSQKILIQISDTNKFVLLDKSGHKAPHKFGDTIKSNAGLWTLTANANILHYLGDEIQIGVSDPGGVILGYQNALKIESQEKPATVINISLSDPNSKRAEDFINYLIYFYKKSDLAEKTKITQSTLDFIDRRLDSLSGQLNHTENNIEGYRSQNGLTDINQQSQIYLQGAQANSEKINEINTQLNVIDQLETYLNEPGNNDTNVPSTVGITDQHLSELVQKLSDVELERNKLLATLPEKNPAFDPINSQIAALKQEIKSDVADVRSTLVTTRQSLQSVASNIQTSIKNVPVQEHQLAGMGRQQSNKSSLYDYLLQQREAISLTYASSASEVRLVDAAHTLPQKASKKLIPFAMALALGLLFPAGIIYGRDLIKNSVGSRREIEVLTGLPVIAEFSNIKLQHPIAFENKSNPESFPVIEQFRHLRTQVNTLNEVTGKAAIVLLTSSVANEGKSFISSNLAVSLASSGKKILLIETDIYKPTISSMFGLTNSVGITGYLNGQIPKKDLVQHLPKYPNLDIISSGEFVDNFSELLEQDRFSELVSDIQASYDYILFDTPPIHAINDAYIIAGFCDLTLYVVRYNHTSKSLLHFINKVRLNESLPHMNIVFNGLQKDRDGEGYKYEHYYRQAQITAT